LSYFLNDSLSARLTLSNIGAVAGRQGHLPYGEDFAESGTQQKQHFTSYERDAESGTDYAVNRQYNQSVGRFNRVDPYSGSNDISDPQSLNRYTYVKNDPANATDPLGLLPWYQFLCIINPILCESNRLPGGGPAPNPEYGGWHFGIGFPIGNPFAQQQCSFTSFLTGGPVGSYSQIGRVPDFDPNTTMHGGGISRNDRWFFYFEMMLTWSSGTRADWRFFISTTASGRYTLDLGGGKTENHSFLVNAPFDNPGEGEVDMSSLSRYLWFDAPSFAMTQRGNDGLRHPVKKATIQFLVNVRGVRGVSIGCRAAVFLGLTIEPGKPPSWIDLSV